MSGNSLKLCSFQLFLLLLPFACSCCAGADAAGGDKSDSTADEGDDFARSGDADADGDSDGDADSDGDSDADSDSHGDADSDSDIDNDSDNGSESDASSDACQYTCSDHCASAGGTEMPGMCENEEQKCCDTSDSITDADTDADTDSDSDADGDSYRDTDADGDGGLTIYYIRHAETVANILPADQITFESSNEWSELGESQVAELTEWLLNSGEVSVPDEVLVSPTWRAQNTISPYLVAMDLQGEIWPELTEVDEEPVTGVSVPVEVMPQKWITYPVEADNLAYREGATENALFPESFEEGISVVMMAYDLVMERYSQSGKTLFIAGHAHAGKLLMGLLEGYNMVDETPDKIFKYVLNNTGVTVLKQDPATGAFEVVDSNINDPEGGASWGK